MLNARFWTLAFIALLTATIRLLPHPENFAPVMAVAMFGGAMFRSRLAAIVVPLAAMFVSDVVLYTTRYADYGLLKGLRGQLVVYLALSAGALWAMALLRRARTPARVLLATLAASIFFFLFTNYVGFYSETRYPHTWAGQIESYTAAWPFFRNTLAADLLYTGLLFGGFALAERKWGLLREPQPVTAPAA